MNEKKKKSKKQSEQNWPHKKFTFFIERNLGRYDVAAALAEAEANYVLHGDVLEPASPDQDWIRLCGENDWIAITEDKHIRSRKLELETILKFKAKVIVIRAKKTTGPEKAAIIAKSLNKMARIAKKTPPPFVAGLTRDGTVTVYKKYLTQ